MKELNLAIQQVLIYLHGIWLRRRYIVITAWLVCPVGWYIVYTMPPVYQADSRVYVETRTVLDPILRGLTVQTNADQQVRLLARTLLSRPNLEKIARAADLDRRALTTEEFDRVVDSLERSIGFSQVHRSGENIYRISYNNPEPAIALRVVQETLNVFIETRLGGTRSDALSAENFLNQQIADYERRLIESEQRLSDFRRNNMEILSADGNFYNRISLEQTRIEEVKLSLAELETRLNAAQTELNRLTGGSEDSREPSTQFDPRLAELRVQLDNLRMRFTDNHPDVRETLLLIERIEQQRQEEIETLRRIAASGIDSALSQNELYVRLMTAISELEGEIASRRVRLANHETRLRDLRDRMDLVPQIEAQLTGLNRDYNITRTKYEQLLSRRESAELSRRVDDSEMDMQFRIIDPPRVASRPAGPNRQLYFTMVLMLGVGAGVAMALLRSLISPVMTNTLQLKSISHFPVFGVISHIDRESIVWQVRKHFIYFVILSGALLSIYLFLLGNDLMLGRPVGALMRLLP
ncbi:XrtA system polysaccharide chain length determinant [Alkalimonas sp.]|uniref:XrtA system polysaccharide chain length determinant n=1 Tax=Alkalimonas sp. TaxID=1872453 RepID=UPI00263B0DC0|nr:XrtA system polysaccharide chain length determinant [Alkalimonas sp.]MCC5827060.1 chain length-determining protein [Alkalimonas sp.]